MPGANGRWRRSPRSNEITSLIHSTQQEKPSQNNNNGYFVFRKWFEIEEMWQRTYQNLKENEAKIKRRMNEILKFRVGTVVT